MTQEHIILYRLLGEALVYPDKNTVTRLQQIVGEIGLDMLNDSQWPLASFIHELGELARLPLDQVQGEYTRLFINAYPHVPCPPYESAYREGALLGQAAESVDVFFRQWGVVVDGEQVDHAGAELEFMAFLLTLGTSDALAAADAFMAEHPLAWLPRFADDVARTSHLEFYRATGQLLAAVLQKQPAIS